MVIYYNLIVAFSNFYGIFSLTSPIISWDNYFITMAMTASFFYHLAETKHGLPGIAPLNKFSQELLWWDQIAALSAILYFLPRILADYWALRQGLVGLALMMISNGLAQPIPFAICHITWRLMAFHPIPQIRIE